VVLPSKIMETMNFTNRNEKNQEHPPNMNHRPYLSVCLSMCLSTYLSIYLTLSYITLPYPILSYPILSYPSI
jgi:hypothetical protein